MKKLLIIFLLLSGFSCNPYHPYYFTHYDITASYDPETTSLSANVQMVFVPGQEYHDSITFLLNEFVEILSLAAQELKYYEFDSGRLVLYIEEAVMPGDQIHISLTYSIELDLPEHYSLEEPGIRKGQSWHWGTKKPLGSITLPHQTG